MTYERTHEKSVVNFDWKEAGVENELRRLHDDGETAPQIAHTLTQKFGGMLTRSAVLGKINRMGLSVQQTNTVWTVEFIAELKRLHSEGHHAPHIADQLTQQFGGKFTDSAVYHKIHRLGLVKSKKKGIHACPMDHRPTLDTNSTPHIALSADEIPIKQRKKLLDLKEGGCRWPYGDVGKPDFFFCGGDAEKGQSYCAFHCGMAYARPIRISDQGRPAHSMRNKKLADPMGIISPGATTILDTDAA